MPVTSEGETLARTKELLRVFHWWSSRADHRLVSSETGKLPRSALSAT